MAIMVTDPRNNLLSQLTAVGQQYLAGKQQERLSANEFANKTKLIELMDRLGGASDVREFGQQKELAKLNNDFALGQITADGERRRQELLITTGSNEKIAKLGADAAVNSAYASQSPQPQRITIEQVQAIAAALNGDSAVPAAAPQGVAPQGGATPTGLPFWMQNQTPSAPGAARWVDPVYDSGPDQFAGIGAQLQAAERGGRMPSAAPAGVLPTLLGGGASLTRDVEQAFVDIGGKEDLSAVMTDDLETLKALKVKYSDLPWYKSNRNTEASLGYLNARINELQNTAKRDAAKAGRLEDFVGGVQVLRMLNGQ